jgi:hypothetical protein
VDGYRPSTRGSDGVVHRPSQFDWSRAHVPNTAAAVNTGGGSISNCGRRSGRGRRWSVSSVAFGCVSEGRSRRSSGRWTNKSPFHRQKDGRIASDHHRSTTPTSLSLSLPRGISEPHTITNISLLAEDLYPSLSLSAHGPSIS